VLQRPIPNVRLQLAGKVNVVRQVIACIRAIPRARALKELPDWHNDISHSVADKRIAIGHVHLLPARLVVELAPQKDRPTTLSPA
jgi:hypothetical protein